VAIIPKQIRFLKIFKIINENNNSLINYGDYTKTHEIFENFPFGQGYKVFLNLT